MGPSVLLMLVNLGFIPFFLFIFLYDRLVVFYNWNSIKLSKNTCNCSQMSVSSSHSNIICYVYIKHVHLSVPNLAFLVTGTWLNGKWLAKSRVMFFLLSSPRKQTIVLNKKEIKIFYSLKTWDSVHFDGVLNPEHTWCMLVL